MTWREDLLRHANSLGRKTFASSFGIGIEFRDGSDAFWVLPGEPMSTVEVDDEIQPLELLEQYDRIDRLRSQVLHVLEHHLADQQIQVVRNGNGNWSFDCGTISGEIWAGAPLTLSTLRSATVAETIDNWNGAYWGGQRPSAEQIQNYLAISDSAPQVIVQQRPLLEHHTIAQALIFLGICKAIQNPECLTDPEQIRQHVEPRGRIGRAILRLAERLPQAHACCDLLTPGKLCIDFSDEYGSYDILTRSRHFALRFRGKTPEEVGNELAEDYSHLNEARRRTLDAIWCAVSRLKWNVDRVSSLLSTEPAVYLGATTREIGFQLGDRLTDRLRVNSPECVLSELFAGHDTFLAHCLSALHFPPESPVVAAALPRAPLRDSTPPGKVELINVDQHVIAQMDAYAKTTLLACTDPDTFLWMYFDRGFYMPAQDDWFPMSFWVGLAEQRIATEYPHPAAVQILLDCGDARGTQAARRLLERLEEPHHESNSATIGLIWRYRHEFPSKSRAWLGPDGPEEYDEIRTRLGDPVARRRLESKKGRGTDDFDLDLLNVKDVRRLSLEGQALAHRALVDWARVEHCCSPPSVSQLEIAVEFGWRDIFDALEENPHLLPGLLTNATRIGTFDEPGLLLCRTHILLWSACAPSKFLGRIVATGVNTDLVALAREAAELAVANHPEERKHLSLAFSTYDVWAEQLKVPLAIAWNRCRRFFINT